MTWLSACAGGAPRAPTSAIPTFATDAQTRAIVADARSFLDSLDATGRGGALLPFEPAPTATVGQFMGGRDRRMAFVGERYGRAVWSNFPVSDVPRPGVPLGAMNAAQRAAALHVLEVLLSR